MEKTLRESLEEQADPIFREFTQKLLPGVPNILGVRLPALRRRARKIAKENWRAYLRGASGETFEEIMLQGMVIGYAEADICELMDYTAAFVPKIDNWSVCDSFCSGLKLPHRYPVRMWTFLQPYLHSSRAFEIRFGVVMLLNYYIDSAYLSKVLTLLDQVSHDSYYVKMAVAWAVSMCYVKYPADTMRYLQSCALDDFTYNKALQKITESRAVDDPTKTIIRQMKR